MRYLLAIPEAALKIVRKIIGFVLWTIECLIKQPFQTAGGLALFGLVIYGAWHFIVGPILRQIGLHWPPSVGDVFGGIGLLILAFIISMVLVLRNQLKDG